MMRWALPAESEDNLWRYMEKRWHSPNILESVLNDGVLDQVSEKDSHEVREAQRQLTAISKDMEDFRDTYRERRSKYVKEKRAEAEAHAHKKRKTGSRAKAVDIPDPAWKEKRPVLFETLLERRLGRSRGVTTLKL